MPGLLLSRVVSTLGSAQRIRCGVAAIALVSLESSIAHADDKQECIAAAEAGQAQRDDGHYRTARESFLKCAAPGCPRVVAQTCTKWLHDLDESAPTIVLGARDDQGNDLTDVRVWLDGELFATSLTGKPVTADAGEHVVRFEQEGHVPSEQKLVLRAGEKARIVSATLPSIAIAKKATPAPPIFRPESSSPRPIVVGAIGLTALALAGTGVVFAVLSQGRESDAMRLRDGLVQNACAQNNPPPECGSLSSAVHSQVDELNVATALFAGAGVAAVGAVATWVFWPKPRIPPTAAWMVPLRGGVALQFATTFE